MPAEKFRLTVAPEALPGSCYVCNSASREMYLDTGLYIEYHGQCYICSECLSEMSRLLGFETPERVTLLKLENTELEKKNFDLRKQIDDLKKVVDGFSSLYHSFDVATPIPRDSVVAEVPPERVLETKEELGTGEGETSESSDVEGMAELRPTKSAEFTLEL